MWEIVEFECRVVAVRDVTGISLTQQTFDAKSSPFAHLFIHLSVISRSPPIRPIRPKLIPFRTASAIAAGSSSAKMLISLTLYQLIVASFFLLVLLFFYFVDSRLGMCYRMVSVRVGVAVKLTGDGGDGTANPNAQQWNLLSLACFLPTYLSVD